MCPEAADRTSLTAQSNPSQAAIALVLPPPVRLNPGEMPAYALVDGVFSATQALVA
jgi:hypothetical protein